MKIELSQHSIHRGNLILVNPQAGFVQKETESLVPACEREPSVLLLRRAAVLLTNLMEEIQGWGQIAPVSGWRSLKEQQKIWDDSIKENGRAFTEKYVAIPGHSEHQTGLAIDLGLRQPQMDFIRPNFPYDGVCRTFREKAAGYGWIERYPAGKETVTGIGHEPWHFRYVGVPHAAIMEENRLTLEEYLLFLKQFSYGQNPYYYRLRRQEIRISFVHGERTEAETKTPYSISGNNADGFILTEWR